MKTTSILSFTLLATLCVSLVKAAIETDQKRRSIRKGTAISAAGRKLQRSGLLQLIEEAALQEIQDPHSYQSQALSWLESSPDILVWSDEQIIQRYALACLFLATNSVRTAYTDAEYGAGATPPQWNRKYGWLAHSSECDWYGITCDADGRVSAIELIRTSSS